MNFWSSHRSGNKDQELKSGSAEDTRTAERIRTGKETLSDRVHLQTRIGNYKKEFKSSLKYCIAKVKRDIFQIYLTRAEQLTTGKNIPSKFMFLKLPLTLTPLR